jgi:molybdopterin-guanine dinucleotide biosynthesis protein A
MTDPDDSIESDASQRGTAVVLAGGRSTRFRGGDKALARVGGAPMLVRVVETVGAVAASVVVNCRADQRAAIEDALEAVDVTVRFAVDDRPDEGPLVGLDRALSAVDGTPVFVVACDLPFLDAALLASFVERLTEESGGGVPDAVVPVDTEGYPKPTCGVYRREPLRDAVESALADDDRRLQAVLAGSDVEAVPMAEVDAPPRAVADVDTREDLRALAPSKERGECDERHDRPDADP